MLACGGRSLQGYRKALKSPSPERRIAALKALAEARDREAVPAIIVLLSDEDDSVRKHAARALGRIGDLSGAEPLAQALANEEHPDVLQAVERSLVRIGRASVSPLMELVDSPRVEVRVGAIRALGRLGAAKAVDVLVWGLSDRDPDVRAAAVAALRRIGDPRAMNAIAERVGDTNHEVEREAEDALGGSGYQDDLDRAKRLIRRAPGR